jgi:hypothetical protein
MARTGFDPYQCGPSSALATLQPRSELVRMTGNDSIIMVPGSGQSRRIPSHRCVLS